MYLGEDLVSYVQNLSDNNGAMDLCFKTSLILNNYSGKIIYCLSYNFASMIQSNSQRKVMLAFYEKTSNDQNHVATRLISILLKYPDTRINDYFSDQTNQANFQSFLSNLNFDNYIISEFDGILPGNSFSLYFFIF